jgi:pyruvate,water dikinase
MAADPLQVMFSFAAVQGMMAPITPLGRDVLRALFAAAAGLFGYRYTADTQRVLYPAGERLWVNITQLVRNSIGKKITTAALGMVEPSAQQALSTVIQEPGLQPGRSGIRPRTVLRLLKFFLPTIANFAINMAAPARRRKEIYNFGEQFVSQLRARNGAIEGDAYQRIPQILALFDNILEIRLPGLFIKLVSTVAAGMASLNLVSKLASQLPGQAANGQPGGWTPLALEITRGLPNNPTTEMDLRLWEIASVIQTDPDLLAEFSDGSSEKIAQRYASDAVSYEARELIDGFLQQYGSRGLAEIDTGRPRWREEPQHIIEMLIGYLQINDPLQTPDIVFARGAQSAEAAVNHLEQGLQAQRGGWI